MGFLETLLILGGLGAAGYFTVYYVIPAMQQMAYAPYYYMQAAQAAQQQYQQPQAPAPSEPVTSDATLSDTPPAEDNTQEGEEPLSEQIEEGVEDVLEDAGLTKDAPEEEKDKKKKSSKSQTATSSKEEVSDYETKRAQSGAKAKREAQSSGFKRKGPSLMGLQTYVFPTTNRRYFYVDEYGQYWEM